MPFHAYSVCGAFELDGARYIVLRNTWGNFVPNGPGTVGGIWNGRPLGVGGLFAFEASRVRRWFEGVHYLPR